MLSYDSKVVKANIEKIRENLGLDLIEFREKIALRLPQALGLCYETDVEPELGALQVRLGLSEDELRKIALGAPRIIGLRFIDNVEPGIISLEEELGTCEAAKAEVFRKPASLQLKVRGSKRGS